MSSQGQEDAILEQIFATIGVTNRVAVEFGARDGVTWSNTHALRQAGWTCVLLDAKPKAPIVQRAFLTVKNLNATLRAQGVPPAFDLLSIDVDGNDFHLWRALDGFRPRVVVIEYNAHFAPDQRLVMPYRADHRWDKTTYYGASASALIKLGQEKGYALVAATPPRNLFFVVAEEAALLPVIGPPPAQSCGYPSAKGRRWEVY